MKPFATQDQSDKQGPETRSADLVGTNVEALKALFPEAFTEGRIDFEVLKQLLGGAVDEREEKYGLNWQGKRQARQLALTPSTGTLRPAPGDSVDWNTTQNLMIEGDNLEVLKLLQKSYAGKVKMIYIDPPYNTGKDFIYEDDFKDSIGNYLRLTNQIDAEGSKTSTNIESSGRFHTVWLNMLYPRLLLARNLLRNDGAIFISIDAREVHNARQVAEAVFGIEGFVADIAAVTNLKGRNDKKHVATSHEHILIFAKSEFRSGGFPLTDEQKSLFSNFDEHGRAYAWRDLRKRGGPDRREDRPKMFFPLYWNDQDKTCSLTQKSPDDIEIFPLRGDGAEGRWRWGRDKIEAHLTWIQGKESTRSGVFGAQHRFYLDPMVTVGDSAPTLIDEEEEDEESDEGEEEVVERTNKPKSVWFGGSLSTDTGNRIFKELLAPNVWEFPKSVELLKNCVRMGMGNQGIALDFFAGSGTLAQSIFELNIEDGGSRKCLSVQLPQAIETKTKIGKAATSFLTSVGLPSRLTEITKERIRRSAAKVKSENPLFHSDLGFRIFKLDSTNIRPWEPNRDKLTETLDESVEHIKAGRTDQDILFEILLKLGLELTVPIETRSIASKTVYSVGLGTLLVCLAESIQATEVESLALGIVDWHTALAPAVESTVVFRDSAFADDVAKTNLTAILAQHGLENVRSL